MASAEHLIAGVMVADPVSGTVSCFIATPDPTQCERYFELHDLIPARLDRWSEAQLRELLSAARMTTRDREWERALILLAHHRSLLGVELLREAEPHVPRRLHGLWELAVAEAAGSFMDEDFWEPDELEP